MSYSGVQSSGGSSRPKASYVGGTDLSGVYAALEEERTYRKTKLTLLEDFNNVTDYMTLDKKGLEIEGTDSLKKEIRKVLDYITSFCEISKDGSPYIGFPQTVSESSKAIVKEVHKKLYPGTEDFPEGEFYKYWVKQYNYLVRMSVNYGELSSNTQSVESRFIAVWDDLNTALPTSVTGKLSGRIKAIEDEFSTTNPNSKLETLKKDIDKAKTDIANLKKEVDPDDPTSTLNELSKYAKKNRENYDVYVADRLYTDKQIDAMFEEAEEKKYDFNIPGEEAASAMTIGEILLIIGATLAAITLLNAALKATPENKKEDGSLIFRNLAEVITDYLQFKGQYGVAIGDILQKIRNINIENERRFGELGEYTYFKLSTVNWIQDQIDEQKIATLTTLNTRVKAIEDQNVPNQFVTLTNRVKTIEDTTIPNIKTKVDSTATSLQTLQTDYDAKFGATGEYLFFKASTVNWIKDQIEEQKTATLTGLNTRVKAIEDMKIAEIKTKGDTTAASLNELKTSYDANFGELGTYTAFMESTSNWIVEEIKEQQVRKATVNTISTTADSALAKGTAALSLANAANTTANTATADIVTLGTRVTALENNPADGHPADQLTNEEVAGLANLMTNLTVTTDKLNYAGSNFTQETLAKINASKTWIDGTLSSKEAVRDAAELTQMLMQGYTAVGEIGQKLKYTAENCNLQFVNGVTSSLAELGKLPVTQRIINSVNVTENLPEYGRIQDIVERVELMESAEDINRAASMFMNFNYTKQHLIDTISFYQIYKYMPGPEQIRDAVKFFQDINFAVNDLNTLVSQFNTVVTQLNNISSLAAVTASATDINAAAAYVKALRTGSDNSGPMVEATSVRDAVQFTQEVINGPTGTDAPILPAKIRSAGQFIHELGTVSSSQVKNAGIFVSDAIAVAGGSALAEPTVPLLRQIRNTVDFFAAYGANPIPSNCSLNVLRGNLDAGITNMGLVNKRLNYSDDRYFIFFYVGDVGGGDTSSWTNCPVMLTGMTGATAKKQNNSATQATIVVDWSELPQVKDLETGLMKTVNIVPVVQAFNDASTYANSSVNNDMAPIYIHYLSSSNNRSAQFILEGNSFANTEAVRILMQFKVVSVV